MQSGTSLADAERRLQTDSGLVKSAEVLLRLDGFWRGCRVKLEVLDNQEDRER